MSAAHQLPQDYLLDTEVEIELDSAVVDEEGTLALPEAWEPSTEDEERVDRYQRAVRYYRGEEAAVRSRYQAALDRLEESYRAEKARLEAGRARELRPVEQSLGWLVHQLRLFSELVGRKRRVSPYGVLRWTKGRDRVEIADDEEVWAQHYYTVDPSLVRAKFSPDKRAIMAQIKAGGEVPEAVEIVRAPDTFGVEVPE